MNTNIYLVRHAHSTYTPDERKRPLSQKGFITAGRVTELLQDENINVVVSSPYLRAIQTVEGTAEYIEQEVILEEGFKERKLAGKPVDDFDDAIMKVWQDYNFAWPGGESNYHAQQRGVVAIKHVLEQYKGRNIAVGTHGNIMAIIMNYFDKQYDFHFWKALSMPDIYKLTFNEKALVKVKRVWRD
ncbi:histidine phosphatase family protein [Virgibacillus litoralis]|uniref:2,3-bisphosphoglycerate-dependent phosphoglycerate mutase n=1 Tax=Virgibacillus litoralis TaxID=578221 RepID=A0ABS4HE31_9BACI|nr:histidine phosphatase family protein [Virgibacillus litoralis]MBP1948994.1 2,3-bisphosphoglycerate-dependent phosphoglycerate mutase [Virgibacillus litoralis]